MITNVIVTALLTTVIRSTVAVKNQTKIYFIEDPFNATFEYHDEHIDKIFTIHTEGCVIPYLDTFDKGIQQYFKKKANASPCQNYHHRLLENNRTHIIIIDSNFNVYKIDNKSHFYCCYKSFDTSSTPNGSQEVDNVEKSSNCVKFNESIEINDEFIKVKCFYEDKQIYDNVFVFTPRKPPYRDVPLTIDETHNIIIMGIGSLSRQNFHRTMPRTWNLLKKLKAIEFKGYSTVAGNSFQNMIPLLLGVNSNELRNQCWLNHTTLDDCSFIWKEYKDKGYHTAFAEDLPSHGIFSQGKIGFGKSPTDYYINPAILQSENHVEEDDQLQQNTKCMGDRYYYEVLLNYIDNLTTTLHTSKLFGLFWEVSMSYDKISEPTKMDTNYYDLIKKLELSGYLENTIVILLSDHGMDHGTIVETKQGLLEERQPLFYILTPESFRKNNSLAYYNLQINSDRLTTPYDVHKTLLDLINSNVLTNEELAKRRKSNYTQERGISLFLPVPENRTCEMAEISKKWCNCHKFEKLLLNSTKILGAPQFLEDTINNLLRTHMQCTKISTVKVIEAHMLLPGYELHTEWQDFKFLIRTSPGGGVFEAILRYIDRWILIDTIKRQNANYNNYCINDDYLKLFCYCKRKQ